MGQAKKLLGSSTTKAVLEDLPSVEWPDTVATDSLSGGKKTKPRAAPGAACIDLETAFIEYQAFYPDIPRLEPHFPVLCGSFSHQVSYSIQIPYN